MNPSRINPYNCGLAFKKLTGYGSGYPARSILVYRGLPILCVTLGVVNSSYLSTPRDTMDGRWRLKGIDLHPLHHEFDRFCSVLELFLEKDFHRWSSNDGAISFVTSMESVEVIDIVSDGM